MGVPDLDPYELLASEADAHAERATDAAAAATFRRIAVAYRALARLRIGGQRWKEGILGQVEEEQK